MWEVPKSIFCKNAQYVNSYNKIIIMERTVKKLIGKLRVIMPLFSLRLYYLVYILGTS